MNQTKPRRKIIRNGKTAPARKTSYKKTEVETDVTVGIGGKIYQKALQSRDKYRELAREALVSGDRVAAESHFQHADHYNRIISEAHEAEEEKLLNAPKALATDITDLNLTVAAAVLEDALTADTAGNSIDSNDSL